MSQSFKMIAKTLFGLEEVLEKELRQLGATRIEKGVRMVSFEGDLGFMYKANMMLRTAIRILVPIHSFRARNEVDLYDGIYQMDWSKYLTAHDTLAVHGTVASQYFNHSQYVALKTKDAIVDQIRNNTGRRPDVDTKHPDLRVSVHINDQKVDVSIDSSGEPLFKRGYRQETNIAPINEVLAAGLILLSDWDQRSQFIDPMCGSGTIAIEAAMIAANIAPNLNRPEFGFEKWPNYDNALFEMIQESCLKKMREFEGPIIARDADGYTLEKAKENVKNANLQDFIKLEKGDFFRDHQSAQAFIMFNPPYDERIEIDTDAFYKSIGDTLKQRYTGSTAWLITGNLEALKSVGLRPSRKIKVYNGKLEARFVKYEMYRGTKKLHKLVDGDSK
ncbi:THUMP domain-containing class I SAM-dependent RNA methyltransferase [Nonlabens ulvanivorans]|uniref:THUMP domain-containing class I SAM-dependent RNA methyltransferase n=1 Tax=Nonlabens ulvanivorans TaxID=906888 RepID=UPI002943ED1F|nr:THUMP domain-containing protein [Nonlabens ulvanivorans]WOI23170.1 THUMP domain-containing protein [Nonlabens ulvanivorans]